MAKKKNALETMIENARQQLANHSIEVVRAFKSKKASEAGDGVQAHITVSAFGAPTNTFRIYRKNGVENVYPESTKVGDKFWDNFRPKDQVVYDACKAVVLDKFKAMA